MELRSRRIVIVVAAIAAALVIAEIATSGGRGGEQRKAPALPSDVLVPPRVTLATLSGGPALINYWASWCHPCEQEAPELQRLASHPPRGTRIVGVDFTDDRGAALKFIRAHGWHYPNLRDADGTVGRRYGVAGLPTTFILDRQGRIVSTLRGPQTAATFERAIHSAG